MARKPALRTELLVNLAILAAAALTLGVVTVSVVAEVAPERAMLVTLVVVALDVVVFVLFGRYLVNRLILRPVERLVAVTDAVAGGDFGARAPDAETADFQMLAARLNRMTDHLLDAQSQVVRTEKLASLGLLAAGIAHEVGNPLGALGTYTDVLLHRGGDPEVLAGVRREIDRIDHIVRSLLDYARPREEALASLDPGAVIAAAHALLDAQGALRQLETRVDVAPDLPAIRGRAHLLEQVIVNLVLNAVDAVPAGGTVVLGGRRWAYEPGRWEARRESDALQAAFPRVARRRPGRVDFVSGALGALLFVADSGPGVPLGERDRVFEPFVTTKAGQGTGLGLAIVARLVDDMGGVVWVDTAREGGAAFKMFFPAADGAEARV
jgi:two-component system, NtrC family, sensor kinase